MLNAGLMAVVSAEATGAATPAKLFVKRPNVPESVPTLFWLLFELLAPPSKEKEGHLHPESVVAPGPAGGVFGVTIGQAAKVQEGPVRPTYVPPGHRLASEGQAFGVDVDVEVAVGQAANWQEAPTRPTKLPSGHILASKGQANALFPVLETVPLSFVIPEPLVFPPPPKSGGMYVPESPAAPGVPMSFGYTYSEGQAGKEQLRPVLVTKLPSGHILAS